MLIIIWQRKGNTLLPQTLITLQRVQVCYERCMLVQPVGNLLQAYKLPICLQQSYAELCVGGDGLMECGGNRPRQGGVNGRVLAVDATVHIWLLA
jgi:hypothetical protein